MRMSNEAAGIAPQKNRGSVFLGDLDHRVSVFQQRAPVELT